MACSTQKNKFLNRNWHAMNTYYNTIYNGNLAIDDGIQGVVRNYSENYWEILPVERMQEAPPQKDIFDTDSKQEEAKNPDFKRAEVKAVKAIQKHAMFIGGEERNFQMDETFILLGKARYHGHRFIQAKDAFLYVINHYPESSEIVDAKIWTEKVNMRLKYYDLALKNLLKIKQDYPDLEEEDKTHLHTILAEAYILNEKLDSAIEPLNKAIFYSKSDTLRGRLLYIKAQIFDKLEQTDSANYTYQKIIDLNRRSPRTYMIHARLEQIKNIDKDTANYALMQERYQELIENRENRPFLDFIYFDYAEYHNQIDSVDLAIELYNKSLKRQPKDNYLFSRDYLRLADIYFDRNNYKTAGAYYDSTLTKLDQSKREYRQIAKKRENLDDVIKYEGIANEKDSILNLVKMPKEERIAFFEEHIEKLKEEAQSVFAQKSASQMAIGNNKLGLQKSGQQRSGNSNRNLLTNRISPSGNTGKSSTGGTSFYFYDNNQAQKGLLTFKQTWGNIPLTDNWKYGGTRSNKQENGEEQEEEKDPFANDPRYQTETYLAEIPTSQGVIDTLWIDRNFAYYQLGVIYKEKFKEYELARNKFENLLESDPEERLVLPSIYNLYLIAEEMGDSAEMNKWKNKILNEHSDSEYATLLLNPEALKSSENNPLNIYKRLYKSYENKQYAYVVNEAGDNAKKFIGRPIAPKFELLKAYAIAKIEGSEAYKEALNYVALTYPQSDEGKFAQKKYNELKKLRPNSFSPDDDNLSYKLVYYFTDETRKNEFVPQLESGLEELENKFKVTQETFTANQSFVVVDGLSSLLGAQGLAEILIKEELLSKEFDYFAISEENYNILQIYKNLDEYLDRLNK
jgi:tetratricopeptide (TPR) repeat protein